MKAFEITYKNQLIEVKYAEGYAYTLNFPDGRLLILDRNVSGWIIEKDSDDYWNDADISALGDLVDLNEPVYTDEEIVFLLTN